MPPLTRGAAALLQKTTFPDIGIPDTALDVILAQKATENALGLRKAVRHKTEDVWTVRNNIDAYTEKVRSVVVEETPSVDHICEVQLAEHSLVRALHTSGVSGASLTALGTATILRDAMNGVFNLNVTTMRVNQAKRGPFTAAMNRLRAVDERGSLRVISIEELARRGKGKWLVDDGLWANIECEIVKSFDVMQTTVDSSTSGLRSSHALGAAAVEELGAMLSQLGVM